MMELEQSILICAGLAAFGGILEVCCATSQIVGSRSITSQEELKEEIVALQESCILL